MGDGRIILINFSLTKAIKCYNSDYCPSYLTQTVKVDTGTNFREFCDR